MRSLVSAIAVLASMAVAQVPNGHYVVSGWGCPGPLGQQGGVYVVAPRTRLTFQAITGLGPELTGERMRFLCGGANAVAVRPGDGSLVVGETGRGGEEIDLHILTLEGLAVTGQEKTYVGTALVSPGLNPAGIWGVKVLPNEDVLIAVSGLAAQPPLGGERIGIVSKTGGVTPVRIVPPPVEIMALDADASGSMIYYVEFELILPCVISVGPCYVSRVFAVPRSGGAASELATFCDESVLGLAFNDNGLIYLAISPRLSAGGGYIASLDPSTGSLTRLASVSVPVGIAVERSSGDLVIISDDTINRHVFRMAPSGAPTLHAALTSGVLSDIAVNHNPTTYGNNTPATHSYNWHTTPNPGGLPRIGNASFGLQLESTGPSASGALLVSATHGSTAVAGIELLLGLPSLLHLGGMPPSGNVPLPIPLDPNLVGGSLFFQTLHLDPGGLAASDGFRMTVMR